jgi:Zn-dependent M32 family carboxypeptidase
MKPFPLALQAKFIDPNGNPYDVLLDEYEKGMTSARLDEIFTEVGVTRQP